MRGGGGAAGGGRRGGATLTWPSPTHSEDGNLRAQSGGQRGAASARSPAGSRAPSPPPNSAVPQAVPVGGEHALVDDDDEEGAEAVEGRGQKLEAQRQARRRHALLRIAARGGSRGGSPLGPDRRASARQLRRHGCGGVATAGGRGYGKRRGYCRCGGAWERAWPRSVGGASCSGRGLRAAWEPEGRELGRLCAGTVCIAGGGTGIGGARSTARGHGVLHCTGGRGGLAAGGRCWGEWVSALCSAGYGGVAWWWHRRLARMEVLPVLLLPAEIKGAPL